MKWKFSLIIYLFLSILFTKTTLGVDDYTGSASVTAKVIWGLLKDPVLVAPANGSFLSMNKPTFIFNKTAGNGITIDKYQMDLNEAIYFDEIFSGGPPSQQGKYYFTSNEDTITLIPNSSIPDGVYTWKIRAIDILGRTATSNVWTFTIDTKPPFLIITQVGEHLNLNLSSKDPNSTPPDLAFITGQQKPILAGLSEPGIKIQIKLTSSSADTQTLLATTDSSGSFKISPAKNLALNSYKVTAIAIDAAGNTTILPDFMLIYELASGQPQPWPLPVFSPGAVVKPPAPPEFFKPPENLLELPAATLVRLGLSWLPYLTCLILLSWFIASKYVYGFGFSLSLGFLKSLIFFPIFPRKQQSQIVSSLTNTGLPFSLIEINPTEAQQIEGRRRITNKNGYFDLYLDKGDYRLKASHSGFLASLNKLTVKQSGYPGLTIPLTPKSKTYDYYLYGVMLVKTLLILALIFGLISLLYLPSLLSLVVFILCLDLGINFLLY